MLVVAGIDGLDGIDSGGAGHAPVAFALLHVAVALLQGVPWRLRRRGAVIPARIATATMACIGLPAVFSALAWVLPQVHPEPYELLWYRCDLALFGREATAPLRAALPTALVLPLQLVYAAFYVVPMSAALLVLRGRGAAAFDRAVAILVGSFLCSYLGYLWLPTLGPKVVFAQTFAGGGALAAGIGAAIDAAEANPWDCFPSGHTMLSVTSALLVGRWARRWLWALLLVVVPLVASTVLLRYHWPIDVAAGAVLAWPVVWICDWLLDRDGAAAA